MKKIAFALSLCAMLLISSCCKNSCREDIECKVESTLSRMTLDEKIAIIHAQSKFSAAGVPRLGIPEMWTMDGPHGVRPETLWDAWAAAGWTTDSCTAYPVLTCLAASWDKDLAGLYGRSVGEEARYRKKNVLLGPGVNICRTPLGGRNFEYMGEDPFLAGKLSERYVKGVQSNNVAVCVKHFALNNQETNRFTYNAIVDDRTLYEIYLPAFKSAIVDGGAWSVMGAYNLYQNQHLCHNHRILVDILKGEWGFDGAVISDWGGTHDTIEAAKNGLDMEFGTHTNGETTNSANGYDAYYLAQPYKRAILNGEIGTDELDDKARRVLRLGFRTEMGGKAGWGRFGTAEHVADCRRIGSEGIVLLKNQGDVLPMCADAKKIVVLGENAIKPMAVGGSSSSLKVQHEITPLEGIRNAFPGAEVVYERCYLGTTNPGGYNYSQYDISDPRTPGQLLADALAAVGDADYVVFVGGLNKHKGNDCEGRDRSDYHLPYGQDEIISRIAALRPDMIYVNMSGSPVAMPFADDVAAILQAWYLGSETGNALADVLTGKVNPSGKLPFSFPYELEDGPVRTEAQFPGIVDENGISQVEYSEGIYVGYRWYDAQGIKPRYAFGYGLSYTTFEYGQAGISSARMKDKVKVSVPVRNTGKVAGAEVVQLYISDTEASVDRPVKELKGFEKVYLEPGQSRIVTFEIGRDALCFFDAASHEWVAEKGEFKALVGAASDDIRTEVTFNLVK